MSREILDRLWEDVNPGELVALIEKPDEKTSASAWLIVYQGVDVNYTSNSHPNYRTPLKIKENDESLVILSNNTLLLGATTETIGRIGFHVPNFTFPVMLRTTRPQEIYIGEYEIKQGLLKHPELAVYARLIDTFPD